MKYMNFGHKSVTVHIFSVVDDLRLSGIHFLPNYQRLLSYGPPWAHYLGGYQDRLLGGPLGLPGLRCTAPEGVEHKDYTGVVLG
jgi:hypothetical protein